MTRLTIRPSRSRFAARLVSGVLPLNMRPFLPAFLLILPLSLAAQSPSVPTSAAHEITQLVAALGQSRCQFYRNGSWYGPKQAQAHLQRKYNYLAKRKLVTTTESFIDLAASKSSLSGKPYQVRCPGSATIESRHWLLQKLAILRRSGRGANDSFKPKPFRGSA